MNEQKPKVFISYSWEDKAISRKLANCLRRDGAQVWIDYSENKAGDSFIKKMNSGLEWCDTFVLLWSESAANSNFVSMEWEGALANNLKIIPCLLDKTKLPFILSGRIYKDLSDFDEGYSGLAIDLKLVIKEEKPKEIKKVVKTPPKTVEPKPEVIKPKITVFRSNPKALSKDDVKIMLKKYEFYCKENYLTNDYCNPTGKGFNHQYEVQNIGGDSVVYDGASGLMWQQGGSYYQKYLAGGNKWIIKLNKKGYAGYHDWRLPTLEEAMSLIEPDKKKGRYINPIFNRTQKWIWTADQITGKSWTWVVTFGGCCCGNVFFLFFVYFFFGIYVRAVRSGQSS